MKNPFEVFSPRENWHEVQQPADGRDDDSVSTDCIRIASQTTNPPFSARFGAVEGGESSG